MEDCLKFLQKNRGKCFAIFLVISVVVILLNALFNRFILFNIGISFFFAGFIIVDLIYLIKGVPGALKAFFYFVIFFLSIIIGVIFEVYIFDYKNTSYFFSPFVIVPTLILLNLRFPGKIKSKVNQIFGIKEVVPYKKKAYYEYRLIRYTHNFAYKIHYSFSMVNASLFMKRLRSIVGIVFVIAGVVGIVATAYIEDNVGSFVESFGFWFFIGSFMVSVLGSLIIAIGFVRTINVILGLSLLIIVVYKLYFINVILSLVVIFVILPFLIILCILLYKYLYNKKNYRFFTLYDKESKKYAVDMFYLEHLDNEFHKNYIVITLDYKDNVLENIRDIISFVAWYAFKNKTLFVGFIIDKNLTLYFYTNNLVKNVSDKLIKYVEKYNCRVIRIEEGIDIGWKNYDNILYPDIYKYYEIENGNIYYNLIEDNFDFEKEMVVMYEVHFVDEKKFYKFAKNIEGFGYEIFPYDNVRYIESTDIIPIVIVIYSISKIGLDKLNHGSKKTLDILNKYDGELVEVYINDVSVIQTDI